MKRRKRRELDRLSEGAGSGGTAQSPVFRYLSAFHNQEQEMQRTEGKALIPIPNEHLRGFMKVNSDMVAFIQGGATRRLQVGPGCHIGGDDEAGCIIQL